MLIAMYSYLVMMNPLPTLFCILRFLLNLWQNLSTTQPRCSRKSRRCYRFSPILVLPALFCCYSGVMMSTHSFVLGIDAPVTKFPSLAFASRVYNRRLFGKPISRIVLSFQYHPRHSYRPPRWRRRRKRRGLDDPKPADDDPPISPFSKLPDPDPFEELSYSLLFPSAAQAHANTAEPSTEGAPLAWDFLSESPSSTFPVTIDSGATISITPHRDDFVEYSELTGSVLQGLAKGLPINGTGIVRWRVQMDDGSFTELEAPAYHVSTARCRLFSPQSYLQHKEATSGENVLESFVIRGSTLQFETANGNRASIHYNPKNNLPTCKMSNVIPIKTPVVNHGCVTDSSNPNLSTAQKELIKWHYRLCHHGLAAIQRLMQSGALGSSPLIKAASKCELPKCASCQFGKAKRRPTDATQKTLVREREYNMKKETLFPGQRVSMDHFVVKQKGRLYTSKGQSHQDSMYSGGCIFVDHATGDIHIEHLVNFTATETIAAKQRYEKRMFDLGITVQAYQSDNGIFASNAFVNEIESGLQNIKFSGVGAHHQNGIAERAIGTILSKARTILIHAAIRWPDAADTSLWPMAVDYVVFQHNHMPRTSAGMMSPIDLIVKSKAGRQVFQDMHVWGCPCYVLDPTLQDGHKLPKWKPRSRRGIFLGFSRRHSSRVPLVLNTRTGHISPQFHVVFDDWFTSVIGTGTDRPFNEHEWTQLFADARYHYAFDEDDPVTLADEWIEQQDDNVDRSAQIRRTQQRVRFEEPVVQPQQQDGMLKQREQDKPAQDNPPTEPNEPQQEDPQLQPIEEEPVIVEEPPSSPTQQQQPPPNAEEPSPSVRRSGRTRKAPLRWGYDGTQGAGYRALASFAAFVTNAMTSTAYRAYLDSDTDSDTFGFRDPIVFQASSKKNNPDLPSYYEAMTGDDREGYIAAMGNEVKELEDKGTWVLTLRSEMEKRGGKALPSTWAFRRKRYPDGSVRKLKARLCVRGDRQTYGLDYFETYAPVVQWVTIRLVLLMVLVFQWETVQTDYTNAFAQAFLTEDVYMELPKDFAPNTDDGKEYVLHLKKSLYGLKQAPLSWYDHLKGHLEQRGFKQSAFDPCLFYDPIKRILCLVYIDDVIWAGPDKSLIMKVMDSLKDDLEMTVEGDVSAYLGIDFERLNNGQIKLKQYGLIDKVLKATGLQDCNPDKTPASQTPLGKDQDGEDYAEQWSYASVVGMLLYLASNSRPEIAYAVHQCARFTHNPKTSHAKAVKRICRYLKGTRDQGMTLTPSKECLSVDCYVDADFAGQWNSEDPQDPLCVKSRTGYVLMVANCPVHWVSKLQTEIAVSTMEAEYIALSLAMRDLIPLRGLVDEIKAMFDINELPCRTYSKVFEDNNGTILLATTPRMTPRSKHIAVKYHFFKEHVYNGNIRLVKVASDEQVADCLTKGLDKTLFQRARKMLSGW